MVKEAEKQGIGLYSVKEMRTLIKLEDTIQVAQDLEDIPSADYLRNATIFEGFRQYDKARKLGIQMEANEMLLAEGLPQDLTQKQKLKLKRFDNRYGLSR